MVHSQVRRGRPGRCLQSLGNPQIDVYRALHVSCESPIRATCPKKRSRLVWMRGSNCGGEPARSRIIIEPQKKLQYGVSGFLKVF